MQKQKRQDAVEYIGAGSNDAQPLLLNQFVSGWLFILPNRKTLRHALQIFSQKTVLFRVVSIWTRVDGQKKIN